MYSMYNDSTIAHGKCHRLRIYQMLLLLRRYRPIVDTNTLQTARYSSHLHVRVKAQRANKLSSEVEYNMYSTVS